MLFSLAALLGGPVHAEEGGEGTEEDRGTTVLERAAAGVGPLGVRVGDFVLSPRATAGLGYDSNIYLVDTETVDDYRAVVTPALALNSDWNNHQLNFVADGTIGRNSTTSKEDYEDFHGGLNGRLDIARDSQLFVSYDLYGLHEDRGSQNDVRGETPTEYQLSLLDLRWFQRLNRLSLTLDGAFRTFDFDDVPAADVGIINNDDRDRSEVDLSLRAGWGFVPQVEGFVRVAVNERSYDDAVDDNGFARDSQGVAAVVGTTLDFGGVTYGDVYAGYRSQTYDETRLTGIDEFIVGAELVWNPSRRTTFTGAVRQSVEETIEFSASGYLATDAMVGVDHAVRRNLIVSADVGTTRIDYKGIRRRDDVARAGLRVRYTLNRNWVLWSSYAHSRRDSDVAGGYVDYEAHRFNLGFEVRL